ncbi:MAG: hypothetical protein ACRC2H_01015 [Silanimonas sp.]
MSLLDLSIIAIAVLNLVAMIKIIAMYRSREAGYLAELARADTERRRLVGLVNFYRAHHPGSVDGEMSLPPNRERRLNRN